MNKLSPERTAHVEAAFAQMASENGDHQPDIPMMSFGGDVIYYDREQVYLEGEFSKRDLEHILSIML